MPLVWAPTPASLVKFANHLCRASPCTTPRGPAKVPNVVTVFAHIADVPQHSANVGIIAEGLKEDDTTMYQISVIFFVVVGFS